MPPAAHAGCEPAETALHARFGWGVGSTGFTRSPRAGPHARVWGAVLKSDASIRSLYDDMRNDREVQRSSKGI